MCLDPVEFAYVVLVVVLCFLFLFHFWQRGKSSYASSIGRLTEAYLLVEHLLSGHLPVGPWNTDLHLFMQKCHKITFETGPPVVYLCHELLIISFALPLSYTVCFKCLLTACMSLSVGSLGQQWFQGSRNTGIMFWFPLIIFLIQFLLLC